MFAAGSYEPIAVRGEHADRVVAFARRLGNEIAVTVVPRIASRLLAPDNIAFVPGAWKDTSLTIDADGSFVDLFHGKKFRGNAQIAVAGLFELMPISLLIARES